MAADIGGRLYIHGEYTEVEDGVRLIMASGFGFVMQEEPKDRVTEWRSFRDSVTDNFRVINPMDFRVLT